MRRTLWIFVSAALAIFAYAQSASGAVSRQYMVENYSASLTLNFEHRRINGTEMIRVRANRGSINELELDADEIVVDSVLVGKKAQRFSQSVDPETGKGRIRIQLNRPLNRDRRLTLQVTFKGSPAKGLQFFDDQAYTVYNTSHWLVVNHDPSNLATLTLSLNVPSDMVVIANGDNVASKSTSDRLVSEWKEKRAIPDFVFGFAVGRFVQRNAAADKTELRYFGTHHSAAQIERIFHSTPKVLQLFSDKSGVSYPSKTYSQILANGNPQQELGDFTLLPNDYGDLLLKQPDEEWLLAHELAHQWWGIGVACRTWSDFWLNEGVATFMADVFLGEQYGPARYAHEIEIARNMYNGLKVSGMDHPLCYTEWKSEKDAGGRLPYFKGALVLHLLKKQLGEEIFWKGFRAYTRQYWGKTATSRDFQLTMEKAARTNLGGFFDRWVYR